MKLYKRMSLGLLLLVVMLVMTSCFNSSEVKIGVIIPLEGSLEDYGYQIRSGIKMAYEEIVEQQKQGKLKKSYQLVEENEDRDLTKVASAFEKFKAEKVTAIIGGASSAATLALAPLANENRIVLLSPASSSPEINQGNSGDFVFRNYPSDTLEAQQLSNVIFQKSRMQKVLMVRARNAFSEGVTYEMLKFGRQNSTKIPNEVVKFDSDPAKADFKSAVDRVVELNPEGVFLAAYTDELIPLIREIRTRPELEGLYIFTCSAFLPDKVIEVLGKESVEGIIFTNYKFDLNDNRPEMQAFVSKFEKNYHTSPTIFAATGYDAMWILVKALDGINHNLADDVRAQMSNENFYGILGETDFNKRGDVTRVPEVYRIVDGAKTILTKEDIEVIKRDILTRL